jgi:type II secretory pathway pseudopilin PulG
VYTNMDWWTRIRLEVLRGEVSKREVLRREGIHWETLKKVLSHSEPPGYRMTAARSKPKIGAYLERIAQIIDEDKSLPKKQRHPPRFYSALHSYTLMEIIAALAIVAILSSTALPKYVDLAASSRRRVLETGVAKLNHNLLAAWYKGLLEKSKGDFQYFDPTLDGNIVITNQQPGKQPKDGLIFIVGASEKYQLFWTRPTAIRDDLFQVQRCSRLKAAACSDSTFMGASWQNFKLEPRSCEKAFLKYRSCRIAIVKYKCLEPGKRLLPASS